MLKTVNTIIDFVDARLNATILEVLANGALPAPAEDIMASYDFVASAWKGRIASLISSEVPAPCALPGLRCLHLTACPAGVAQLLPALRALPGLRCLRLDAANDALVCAAVRACPGLASLHLAGSGSVTGRSVQALCHGAALAAAGRGDEAWPPLQLTTLSLARTGVGAGELKMLCALRTLRTLDARGIRGSAAALVPLGALLGLTQVQTGVLASSAAGAQLVMGGRLDCSCSREAEPRSAAVRKAACVLAWALVGIPWALREQAPPGFVLAVDDDLGSSGHERETKRRRRLAP
ncbi:hypothetical protein F751_0918 [Auxenochlorella protothecoides]|uniref:Uncharacterized protein n=1 Tax=Auxenochlorella protothecoides TaxID=3075 RepID=A0A087SDA0_AUXPR|nr:hypothetical protein F751_0918 [Auxenochlorella protothecoides]KFM23704.1 hypothetical protein F751_0918 [Auxenochlorella protothecoides]